MMIPSFLSLGQRSCHPIRIRCRIGSRIQQNLQNEKRSGRLYSIVSTAIVHGIDSIPVQVEADVSNGMPFFEMVGFLGAEVREAKERVRTALRNEGYLLPAKRITVNLSPACVRKSGSGFDLPISVALMAALEIIPAERTKEILMIGEVGLNGQVQPVQGILPVIFGAAERGFSKCMIPAENYREACIVPGIQMIPVDSLSAAISYFRRGKADRGTKEKDRRQRFSDNGKTADNRMGQPDFSELHGQPVLKRACEVAVSGMHNLLMLGPPGTGKTMAAKRIPSILPPMDRQEQMELSKIYSVCGLFEEREKLLDERPFRAPHHTVTPQGLAGGGRIPKPGEISLAHHGVLFLDELTEFRKETLETLRQPMEEKQVHLVRMSGTYHYPADFMLVAAMNPCACGNYPDRQKCSCTRAEIGRYLGRVSKPLVDRMDLCVEVPRLTYEEVSQEGQSGESSQTIQKRVEAAWQIQRERYRGNGFLYNSQLPEAQLVEYCMLDHKKRQYLKQIYTSLNLSARTYHKLLKVARTIADLDESREVELKHLNEAVCYRSMDLGFWGQA